MAVPVPKTYKLFVGGKFPRSESGRSFTPSRSPGINVPRGSKKDLRDAVVAARTGLATWSGGSAYLRGQVLYRLAEMLESRGAAMQAELRLSGVPAAAAKKELELAISLVTWYAGLCDKLQGLLGSQNAVQGPFFNFSTIEPTGVIGVIAPESPSLVGVLALVLPLLAGGNSAVVLLSEAAPCASLALGEVCASSDVPAGAINLISGLRRELAGQFAGHRDIDGLLVAGGADAALTVAAADNCKRVRCCDLAAADWRKAGRLRSLLFVEPFVECKTLWHPVAQ